MKYLITQMRDL